MLLQRKVAALSACFHKDLAPTPLHFHFDSLSSLSSFLSSIRAPLKTCGCRLAAFIFFLYPLHTYYMGPHIRVHVCVALRGVVVIFLYLGGRVRYTGTKLVSGGNSIFCIGGGGQAPLPPLPTLPPCPCVPLPPPFLVPIETLSGIFRHLRNSWGEGGKSRLSSPLLSLLPSSFCRSR